MSEPAEANAPQPGDSPGTGARENTEGPPRCVLVVDDDADVTRLLEAALASRGVRCVAAHDAKQGFMAAQKHNPRFILVDWHMPAGGGQLMIRHLRGYAPTREIPVYVVTADVSPAVDAEATRQGANGVLRKPVDPMQLLALLMPDRPPDRPAAPIRQSAATMPPCVLVVDDDPDMVRLLKAALATRGVACVAAYDAKQGFMAAQRHQPRLVLVDWHMPAGGGQLMIRHLRGYGPTQGTPLYVVTADPSPDIDAEAARQGARGVLRKPIDPMQLLDLITSLPDTPLRD